MVSFGDCGVLICDSRVLILGLRSAHVGPAGCSLWECGLLILRTAECSFLGLRSAHLGLRGARLGVRMAQHSIARHSKE